MPWVVGELVVELDGTVGAIVGAIFTAGFAVGGGTDSVTSLTLSSVLAHNCNNKISCCDDTPSSATPSMTPPMSIPSTDGHPK